MDQTFPITKDVGFFIPQYWTQLGYVKCADSHKETKNPKLLTLCMLSSDLKKGKENQHPSAKGEQNIRYTP